MQTGIWWMAVVVALLLIPLPRWGYSGKWKHDLVSGLGIILIICLILILIVRI